MIDVVAAVIEDSGLYLACRRTAERGGLWEFPGGKVESGESFKSALVRELDEELGILIIVGDQLGESYEHAGIRLTCFAATLIGSRPTTSTDHDEMRWLGASELGVLDWSRPDQPVVRLLASSIN